MHQLHDSLLKSTKKSPAKRTNQVVVHGSWRGEKQDENAIEVERGEGGVTVEALAAEAMPAARGARNVAEERSHHLFITTPRHHITPHSQHKCARLEHPQHVKINSQDVAAQRALQRVF
jgi:hypothetical protein